MEKYYKNRATCNALQKTVTINNDRIVVSLFLISVLSVDKNILYFMQVNI